VKGIGINGYVGGFLIAIIVIMALTSVVWTPYDAMALSLRERLDPPSLAHWLGTDEFGRDVLSRLMTGAAESLLVAVCTVFVAVLLGMSLGLIAGYVRGIVDRFMMVISDTLLAFPGTLLALGLMVIVGPNKYGIILALGIAYSPSILRLVRASVMSAREREYVEASRVIGNSEIVTMVRHVLPNCVAPIVVLATSMFGWVILAESGLSFLGLGVPPPAPTWGNMLASARPNMERAVWLGIAPGVCIAMTMLGINLLGDALRDRIDPRMGGH
jgi:peptide/nickel transport system permease protein